jgi:acyl-coenzyme A synthetase/AMP-(fatty) acid ligase
MISILTFIGKRIQTPLPKPRWIICGTAALNIKEKTLFEKLFNVSITQQYGMTEVLLITVNDDKQEEKPLSVGRAVGCEVIIADDVGNTLPTGRHGNICIKSPSAFGSYFNQPSETAATYKGNCFWTGDIGSLDAEGYLTISGRSKDLIKKGGYNINPNEIDSVVGSIPGIIDSATIGVADPLYGEEVYTFVVEKKPIPEELLIAECKKLLPLSHIPKNIFTIDLLPRTSSGKIRRESLKTLVMRENSKSKPS